MMPFEFRPRVAAVTKSDRGILLHRLKGDDFWFLPGGGIDLGETAAEALAREFREELDEEIGCGALLYVVENFFTYDGVRYHELGLYFQAELPPESKLHGMSRFIAHEATDELEFMWWPIASLPELRPRCLRDSLSRNAAGVQHFVQRSGDGTDSSST